MNSNNLIKLNVKTILITSALYFVLGIIFHLVFYKFDFGQLGYYFSSLLMTYFQYCVLFLLWLLIQNIFIKYVNNKTILLLITFLVMTFPVLILSKFEMNRFVWVILAYTNSIGFIMTLVFYSGFRQINKSQSK